MLVGWFAGRSAGALFRQPANSSTNQPITSLVFSPDGAFVLSGGYRSIAVRSAKDGAIVRTVTCDVAQVHDLAFHPNGTTLAVAGGTPGERGVLQLLNWPALTSRLTLREHSDLITAASFNSDGTNFATASADRFVHVRRANGELLHKLTGHAGPVLGVAFSPDDTILVTVSADRSIKVWDAQSGKLLRTLTNHTDRVNVVAFRPQSSILNPQSSMMFCATGSDDKTVRVWQPELGRMVRIVRGHEGGVLALAFSRDGSRLYSAGTEGLIRLIEADSDTILQTWKASDHWINSLAVSPDGRTLASGDSAGRVRLWDAETGKAR